MEPVTEQQIRASFINCSKGEAKRLPVPRDLDAFLWADLDFLGWSDPSFPGRCYVVLPQDDGLKGLALRYERSAKRRAQMCSICLTTHPNGAVRLMVASLAGESGRRGNSIGTYMCEDLACSLYARKVKTPSMGRMFREDFDPDERAAHVREKMAGFIAKVAG